jgi:hypothetical protein
VYNNHPKKRSRYNPTKILRKLLAFIFLGVLLSWGSNGICLLDITDNREWDMSMGQNPVFPWCSQQNSLDWWIFIPKIHGFFDPRSLSITLQIMYTLKFNNDRTCKMIYDSYSEWGAVFWIRHLQKFLIIPSMIHDDIIQKNPPPIFQAVTLMLLPRPAKNSSRLHNWG